MNHQDAFLRSLADFTDLKRKNEDFGSVYSHSSACSAPEHNVLDLSDTEKISRSFKELKDKLKDYTRDNHSLRDELLSQQVEIRQLSESEANLTAINHRQRENITNLTEVVNELKKKFAMAKEEIKSRSQTEKQLEFMKESMVQLNLENEKLNAERHKIMELAIEDKMAMDEIIAKNKAAHHSDQQYLFEIESELATSKDKIMRLENEVRKVEIKYDEEVFNKKWTKENYEKQMLETQVKILQQELAEVTARSKREKERRNDLEKRVVELEESTGLWTVKAETYEGQIGCLDKKMKKMQRRMSQAKKTAEKACDERLSWEERFVKCSLITEELISRIKRELMGDAVQLAKTSEFKLNKLKDNTNNHKEEQSSKPRNTLFKEDCYQQSGSNGPSTAKLSKSNKKVHRESSPKISEVFGSSCIKRTKNEDRTVLSSTQKLNTNQQTQGRQLADPKKQIMASTMSFGNRANDENLVREHKDIEMRIRREREEMEKKLKQKMLYRKIDISCSPDKSKLRGEYLKYVLER